jgi:hypothetical protein
MGETPGEALALQGAPEDGRAIGQEEATRRGDVEGELMGRYSKEHYRRLSASGSKQEDDGLGPIRIHERNSGERAHQEALAKFGAITPENAAKFIAWQTKRRLELIEIRQG